MCLLKLLNVQLCVACSLVIYIIEFNVSLCHHFICTYMCTQRNEANKRTGRGIDTKI